MNSNEKSNAPILAGIDAHNKKSDEPNQLPNSNLKGCDFQYKTLGQSKLSHTLSFACDECSLPLQIYGENYIETYTDGQANPLRCFCNTHAEEFGFLEVQL
jgi:hypothetical protein